MSRHTTAPATPSIPGIAVALDAERQTLSSQPVAPNACAPLPGGALLAVSGIGPERARAAAGRLLAAGATALMSWGVAAGLDPELVAGSLVVPQAIIGADGVVHQVAVRWHAELCALLAPTIAVYAGPVVEARGLLAEPRDKRALRERHRAVAADMESAALARVAAERGLPFLAVRAVADPAGGRVPGWVARVLDASGRAGLARTLVAAGAHPTDWPALARLALDWRAAERTLTRAGRILLGPGTRSGAGAARGAVR